MPPRLLRKLVTDESGMTLIELSVVVALLGVVVAAVLSVMYSAQSNLEREVSRSTSNDNIRLAVESIDREIRSGQVLYDPQSASNSYTTGSQGDVQPGWSIRIYTRSQHSTSGGTAPKCVQWRITSGHVTGLKAGLLQERNWDPTDPASTVSGWRIVATGISNITDSPSVPAFTLPSPNLVNIDLRADDQASKGSEVQVVQSVSGRNTIFNTNSSICGPASPAPAPGANGVPGYSPN